MLSTKNDVTSALGGDRIAILTPLLLALAASCNGAHHRADGDPQARHDGGSDGDVSGNADSSVSDDPDSDAGLTDASLRSIEASVDAEEGFDVGQDSQSDGGPVAAGFACGDVPSWGTCSDNVFRWCSLATGTIGELDCTPLGLTCHVEYPRRSEDFRGGCTAPSCEEAGRQCDGQLLRTCTEHGLSVIDCSQPDHAGECVELTTTSDTAVVYCASSIPCEDVGSIRCDGNLQVVCDENGELSISDCGEFGPDCTCQLSGGTGQCINAPGHPCLD